MSTMKIKNYFFLLLPLFISFLSLSQLEELTPSEKAYSDSIAALNTQNAMTAQSQEFYNKGIQLFGEKNYSDAINQFNKS